MPFLDKQIVSGKVKKDQHMFTNQVFTTYNLLNYYYGSEKRFEPVLHIPYFLDRLIIADMVDKFSEAAKTTMSHKFRSDNDIQFEVLYYHFINEERKKLPIPTFLRELDTNDDEILQKCKP